MQVSPLGFTPPDKGVDVQSGTSSFDSPLTAAASSSFGTSRSSSTEKALTPERVVVVTTYDATTARSSDVARRLLIDISRAKILASISPQDFIELETMLRDTDTSLEQQKQELLVLFGEILTIQLIRRFPHILEQEYSQATIITFSESLAAKLKEIGVTHIDLRNLHENFVADVHELSNLVEKPGTTKVSMAGTQGALSLTNLFVKTTKLLLDISYKELVLKHPDLLLFDHESYLRQVLLDQEKKYATQHHMPPSIDKLVELCSPLIETHLKEMYLDLEKYR